MSRLMLNIRDPAVLSGTVVWGSSSPQEPLSFGMKPMGSPESSQSRSNYSHDSASDPGWA